MVKIKKKVTEMVCILDKSGSMYGKERDTIGSYNRMLNEQKEKDGEAYITTALFSDRCKVLYSHTPIQKAEELTEKEYYADGNTALFDAIGKVFSQVEEVLRNTDEEFDEKVLVFIITDGMENASTEYGLDRIRELICDKQKKGWEILFLGTDMDVINLARKTGIRKENTMRFSNDAQGIASSYKTAGERFSRLRER